MRSRYAARTIKIYSLWPCGIVAGSAHTATASHGACRPLASSRSLAAATTGRVLAQLDHARHAPPVPSGGGVAPSGNRTTCTKAKRNLRGREKKP